MINTIIFDIGNVLVKFDWRPYIYGTFDEATANAVAKAVWESRYWEEFDRGVLSDGEILKRMEDAAPEYKKEIRMAIENAGEYVEQFAYAKSWIKELKKSGYRVLYLSNYGETLMEMRADVLDFLPLMDGGLFSCHAKVIKPDRKIYEMLCEKYDLKVEECLFIDDNLANTTAAKEFGLHAIRFEGYEKSYDFIMDYLFEQRK